MKYQKIVTVEAEQYDGPKLTVVSDKLGEQTAEKGDWLLGTERGKVTVVKAATFAADFKPYSATPADDQVAAQAEAIATLKAELAQAQADHATLQVSHDQLAAQVADLSAKASTVDALTSQNADLKTTSAAATAQAAADEAKLAELTAHLKAFTDAQATLAAEQSAVNNALNS